MATKQKPQAEWIERKRRLIPEDRIKRCSVRIEADLFLPEDRVKRALFESIGREIAAKLEEFHKFSAVLVDGQRYYETSIEVIVPDASGHNPG